MHENTRKRFHQPKRQIRRCCNLWCLFNIFGNMHTIIIIFPLWLVYITCSGRIIAVVTVISLLSTTTTDAVMTFHTNQKNSVTSKYYDTSRLSTIRKTNTVMNRNYRYDIELISRLPLLCFCHHDLQKYRKPIAQRQKQHQQPFTKTMHSKENQFMMVRNIDLPEVVIFYGNDSCLRSRTRQGNNNEGSNNNNSNRNDNGKKTASETTTSATSATIHHETTELQLRSGLITFIKDCIEIDTAVIILHDPIIVSKPYNSLEDASEENMDSDIIISNDRKNQLTYLTEQLPTKCQFYEQTVPMPNPKDLMDIIDTMMIQPRPFGGSSGFGMKYPDPPRKPQCQYTVVIGTDENHSRAARYCGMRILSYDYNDSIADAVIGYNSNNNQDDDDDYDSIDFTVDDISTPGSYWLNPPHPRDDDGNKVDVYEIIEHYAVAHTTKNHPQQLSSSLQTDTPMINMQSVGAYLDDDDEEFAAILSDIAPLT